MNLRSRRWEKPVAVILVLMCCGQPVRAAQKSKLEGDLIIFHAGSLAVPFQQISREFNKLHPHVRIIRESAASRLCARKIADLNKPCDVLASADYTVIETLLIPDHASWCIKFAGNEMVIAYTDKSTLAKQIASDNWYRILLRDDVALGRSDPNADPCGYRTVLTIELAEKYYRRPGLVQRMLNKRPAFIRPKEVDLLALLETHQIDYLFIYRSVAQQHGLKYLLLPEQINLGKAKFDRIYKTAAVRITGKKPGTTVVKRGEAMIYGVTIPNGARNREAALAFVSFLLDENKGLAILARNGQPSVVPSPTDTFEQVPEPLKRFAKPKQPSKESVRGAKQKK